VHTGRVAVRAVRKIKPKMPFSVAQGISYKHFGVLMRCNAYSYSKSHEYSYTPKPKQNTKGLSAGSWSRVFA
jgi:hypothetical protein